MWGMNDGLPVRELVRLTMANMWSLYIWRVTLLVQNSSESSSKPAHMLYCTISDFQVIEIQSDIFICTNYIR